jgi:hypothetical protein
VCESKAGEKSVCPADTGNGLTLARSFGPGACELGRTWGWDESGVWVSEGCSGEFTVTAKKTLGRYTPGSGMKVVDTEHGDLNIRVFTYVRYLNQEGLEETFTDAFGQTSVVDAREDFQVNKAQVYFFGWLLSPKLRYMTYVWSSNASQGLGAQVVVAGNLTYAFNEHFTLGGGITGLPGTRSTSGTFPYWLGVDTRLIGDEFFRPSYTTGIWATGKIVEDVDYNVMLANNLSQLGVDAGQLDSGVNTVSGAVGWMPTTGEFGRGFGDMEHHDELATRFGVRFTASRETRQGQPDTEAFENVQLRISDGNVIFEPGLFGEDVQIEEARYQMTALEAGFKIRGFSLEGEYFRRLIDDFSVRGSGLLPFDELDDDGFQLQASALVLPELQVYAGGSKVFGEYGDPWDARIGLNWYPWKAQSLRWNFELIELDRSPVGALSLPYLVGADGTVFHTNFMLWF